MRVGDTSDAISKTKYNVKPPHPKISPNPTFAFDITSNPSVLHEVPIAKKSKYMKKVTENPANRRMIQERGDGLLYSEDHGAKGKSSNSEEGEDGEESMQPLERRCLNVGTSES